MEDLKPLSQILQPDERNRYFRGGISLHTLHGMALEANLNASVPELVRAQFAIARNAYLYSWFYYPLQAAAFLYSILAIELALRFRVKKSNPAMFAGGRDPTLYPLLEYALQERWIVDGGFEGLPPEVEVADKIAKRFRRIPDDQRHSYNLLDALISLRNDLAHGEFMIGPGMNTLLVRGAELINQLFPSGKPGADNA